MRKVQSNVFFKIRENIEKNVFFSVSERKD